MAMTQIPGSAFEHRGICRQKHRDGHWCWSDAEIETLKGLAALHLGWPIIAKFFTVDGFARHNSSQCFKKWTELFRDPDEEPPKTSALQEVAKA